MRLSNIASQIKDPDSGENLPFVLGKSPGSGWITSSILYEYLVNDFHEWLRKNKIQRPVILFSDFHDTRNNYHLAKRMNELSIIVICLYPNSTHILQPLDVSCFRPLKNQWKKAMAKFNRDNYKLPDKDRKKVSVNNFV